MKVVMVNSPVSPTESRLMIVDNVTDTVESSDTSFPDPSRSIKSATEPDTASGPTSSDSASRGDTAENPLGNSMYNAEFVGKGFTIVNENVIVVSIPATSYCKMDPTFESDAAANQKVDITVP